MNIVHLADYGIQYETGIKNCMGNENFYKKILRMFLEDACFDNAKEAYASGNQKALFSCMHEMKGISGNAALTELYRATVPLVELLRPGNAPNEDVTKMFTVISEKYNLACEGIKAFLQES